MPSTAFGAPKETAGLRVAGCVGLLHNGLAVSALGDVPCMLDTTYRARGRVRNRIPERVASIARTFAEKREELA